jgi:hypothetical protein
LLENAEMFSGNFAGFHAEMGNGRAWHFFESEKVLIKEDIYTYFSHNIRGQMKSSCKFN